MPDSFTLIAPTSRLDEKDIKVLLPKVMSVPIDYGESINPYDVVQMHVYDTDGNLIISVPNLRYVNGYKFSFDTTGETGKQETKFYTDPIQDLKNLGLRSGTYKVVYNFVNYYVTWAPAPSHPDAVKWHIQDISTSRREVRIATSTDGIVGVKFNENSLSTRVKYLQNKYPLSTFILDLGNNDFSVIINQTVSGEALLYKLYKPLPDNIEEKSEVIPMLEMANPLTLYVTLELMEDEEQPFKILAGPNTNVFVSQMYDVGIAYKSWNDLLSTNAATSKNILDYFLSSSNYTDTVNVDYAAYSNFVHFSSAEERVRNFQYKLQLIEQYDATLGALSASMASGSTTVVQNVDYYKNLRRNVINGFDGYENWLYYESGSTYSSSLGFGAVTQSTWPKSNATYPYTLYSVTSSQGIAWFNNQLDIAETYDRDNAHNLLHTVPFHLREDEDNNESYFLFLQMVGQHYDLLWTYANGMTQKYDLQHKLTEGTAKDVIWETMKSYGMDLTNGHDVDSLWKYAFGTNETGSYDQNILNGQSGFERLSSADATKEIWKRLLNNLSYLLKTKGTVRGIKALITCYGIPATILRVKEYGGPEPDYDFESAKYISDEFTYALDFDGNQIVSQSFSGTKPKSVEFRFRVDEADRNRMILFEGYKSDDPTYNFKLSVTPTYTVYSASTYYEYPEVMRLGKYDERPSIRWTGIETGSFVTMSGYLLFEISGAGANDYVVSNEIPVYNGAWWSVLLECTTEDTPTFSLWAKQARDGVIVQEATLTETITTPPANGWTAADTFAIGSSSVGGGAFTGVMQELRFWSEYLNEDVFNNHVLAPLAYNGNTYSSSYYNLDLRWRMNNAEWYTAGVYDTLLLDSNPGQSSTRHGYWSGSNSASVIVDNIETNYYESPSIGFRRMVSNKVRVDTYVSESRELDRKKRVTLNKYDRAPLDSNRVGIYLSPTELINEDIIRTFAGLEYDDFIGSPMDYYERTYYDLNKLNTFYWTKYGTNPNIYTYFRVLSYFDKSLFGQIRKMLPARVEAIVGYLFEQHMLERPKVVTTRPPSAQHAYYTASMDLYTWDLNAELPSYTASIYAPMPDLFADVGHYSGVISASNIYSSSADMLLLNATPISATASLFADYFTYSTSMSVILPYDNPYSYRIMTISKSVSNNLITIDSSSYFTWSATGSIINPACDFWWDSGSFMPATSSVTGAITTYSRTHFIFHRWRFTERENLFFRGCLQTVNTTPDKGLPFESFDVAPNILVVVNASEASPRLNVE